MEKEAKPLREYFGIILFIILWLGLFLILVGLLFTKHIGIVSALKISLGFWFFIIIVFALIILANITYILIRKIFK